MTKYLNTTNVTVAWLKKTNDDGNLQMTPPFQRNPVWSTAQKSYLIDSILNGFPIPEIYMQKSVDEEGKELFTIVDGQQRIRACLEYIEGLFALSEEDSPSRADMKFDDLSPSDKKTLFGYTFIVRVLPDLGDSEIRGIFQRLNKNVVALNAQELRQATYWGPFIRTMQEISDYDYWSTSGVFTPSNVRRMMDVEYISELAVAILRGHQNKKETLDDFYLEFEVEFDEREGLLTTFQTTLFEIEQLLPDIKNTRWRKKTDFYSLFVFLASKQSFLPLNSTNRKKLRKALDNFAAKIDGLLATNTPASSKKEKGPHAISYAAAVRASSDINNRRKRGAALEAVLGDFFNQQSKGTLSIRIRPVQAGLFAGEDEGEQ